MKKVFKAIINFFKKIGYSIAAFFVLTIRQLKKVRWANKATMKETSKIVFAFIILFGLYIVLDDFIIAKFLKMFNY